MKVEKKVLFNSPFLRVRDDGEKNSGEIIVESAGYIPPEIQIKNIMRSGEELMLYRKGLYSPGNFGGKDEKEAFENYDPTTKPGFDVIDAQRLLDSESKRLEQKYSQKPSESVSVVKEETLKEVTSETEN